MFEKSVLGAAATLEPLELSWLRQESADAAAIGERAVPATLYTPIGPVEAAELPGDTFFDRQWHLLNLDGVDINVVDAWTDYTGNGVTLGVVDVGVQLDHPDLDGQFDPALDGDVVTGDSDPSAEAGENHATAVAGTLAAARNGEGVVGVAYDADVAVQRMEFGTGKEDQIAAAFRAQEFVDVSNNSWGYDGFFFDDLFDPDSSFAESADALVNTVQDGRGGLGTVFVFAAGNGREDGQNVNYHGFQNSPHTIAVAAVDDQGEISSFSTPGAALLVSAPGDAIVTTDRTGDDGYVRGDYVSISGTSFAAPNVAGAVALMLEANPGLGYRDVQEILAYSAVQTDETDRGWVYNGASNWNGGGLHVSHDYGFGLVDATAAVRLAETWGGGAGYIENPVSVSRANFTPISIPDRVDNKTGIVKSNLKVGAEEAVEIDQVLVTLDIAHSFIGDLVVTLTSPSGTTSKLVQRPGKTAESEFGSPQNDIAFTLNSTQFWGESSAGKWKLKVADKTTGDTGTLNSWKLTFIGDDADNDDLYVFTDEYGESLAAGSGRLSGDLVPDPAADGAYILSDTDGGFDTVNAAAVTSSMILDLGGGESRIDGTLLTLAPEEIDIAFAGDGDDRIIGNNLDNRLSGGRGDDSLTGGAGDDIFSFYGRDWGNDVIEDFLQSADTIDFSAESEIGFANLGFVQEGGTGTAISVDGFAGTIFLADFAGTLAEEDFNFAASVIT